MLLRASRSCRSEKIVPAALFVFLILILVTAGNAAANDTYFDGGVASSVFAADYDTGTGGTQSCGTSGCHDEPGGVCTGGSVTNWGNYNCAYTYRVTIESRINADTMPPGAPFTTKAAFLSSLGTWSAAGYPKTTPTASTSAADLITNSSARLNGSFNPNTSGTGGTYGFRWGTTSPPLTLTTTPTITGTSSSARNRTISGLACGTTHYFRARVTNGGATVNGSIDNFNTLACSNPTLSLSGPGSSAINRISVPKNGSFTQASLSISTSDADTSINSWTFGTPSSGSLSGVNTSTGAFTYNAPATAGNATFTIRVTDADPASGGGPNNSPTRTVYITVTDTAPEFRSALFPAGGTITGDSLTVSEGDGSTPSQGITMFAYDADAADTISWSVISGPSQGNLSAFGSGTSTSNNSSNSISYTPNNNVDTNDSFTIRITDGTTDVDLPITANVTPVPDNPTAGDDGPFIFDVGVPVVLTVLTNDGDVDTGDTITVDGTSFTGVTAGASVSAVNSNTQIQYTSSGTQFTNDTFQYGVVDSTARTSNLATVTLTPRDTDSDGVIDFLDNCAATPNPAQTDTDGDQVINVNTPLDPADPFTGGDACDVDDDGDLITDIDEINNSLDPLDPTDALLDNDGDGIDNITEINVLGTNPNLANLTIDATGYFTPYDLIPPNPTEIHSLATALSPSNPGPYRPGDNTVTWTPSNISSVDLAASDPGNLVSNPPNQAFFVRPLLNFAADQRAEEGDTVNVQLSINGDAPIYPVTVNYSVSGTATPGVDFTAPAPVSGSVVFNDTTPQNISFMLTAADGADPGETIVFTIDSATNAAIGDSNTHVVSIIESNVAPQASIRFVQGANEQSSAIAGTVDIDAVVTDVNVGDAHTCDWSATDGALVPPVGNVCSPAWTTPALLADTNYLIDVTVTDNGTPARSTRVTRILNVVAAPTLNAVDTDGDGTNDDVEGFDDSDGNGVPDYLDPYNAAAETNIIPDQTGNFANSYVLETEPGLTLKIGSISQAASSYGALITDTEITDHGSITGGPPVNPNDSFSHFGGIFNFEISGLTPGGSARVVIPLQASIPRNAVLRKYNPASGWGSFQEDANNRIESAAGSPGACPSPGSADYQAGLGYLHSCIQLTISDGGPNDNNGAIDGVISDPVAIGAQLTDPEGEEVESGSSRVSPFLLSLMLLLALFSQWRRLGRGLPA